eukprot:9293107-Alexandrium_andersonii.AAC.1
MCIRDSCQVRVPSAGGQRGCLIALPEAALGPAAAVLQEAVDGVAGSAPREAVLNDIAVALHDADRGR